MGYSRHGVETPVADDVGAAEEVGTTEVDTTTELETTEGEPPGQSGRAVDQHAP